MFPNVISSLASFNSQDKQGVIDQRLLTLGHDLEGEALVRLLVLPRVNGFIDAVGSNVSWVANSSSGGEGRTSYPDNTPLEVDEEVLETVASCADSEEAPSFG